VTGHRSINGHERPPLTAISDHCVRVGRLTLDAADRVNRADEDIALWDAAATAYAGVAGQSTDSFARRFVPFLAEQVGNPLGNTSLMWDAVMDGSPRT
jgi:hypothetical protein